MKPPIVLPNPARLTRQSWQAVLVDGCVQVRGQFGQLVIDPVSIRLDPWWLGYDRELGFAEHAAIALACQFHCFGNNILD